MQTDSLADSGDRVDSKESADSSERLCWIVLLGLTVILLGRDGGVL